MKLQIVDGPDYRVDDEGWEHHAYTLKVRDGRRWITTPWKQGLAITEDPQLSDVLESLCSDARCGEMEFEEFCNEFGYDADSKRAEQTWEECQRMAEKLDHLGISA